MQIVSNSNLYSTTGRWFGTSQRQMVRVAPSTNLQAQNAQKPSNVKIEYL